MARTKSTARRSAHTEKKDKKEKHGKSTKKASKAALKSAGGVKKPHRFRSGTQVKREIRRLQSGKDWDKKCIPTIVVDRIIREFAQKHTYGDTLRWGGKSIKMIHEALEYAGFKLFEKTQELNGLRKRVGIEPEGLLLAAKTVFGEEYFTALGKGDRQAVVYTHTTTSGAKAKASKKVASKKPAKKVSESSDSDSDDATFDASPATEQSEQAVDDSAMDQDIAATTQ